MNQIIQTRRLELRTPVTTDAPALALALNNYEITKWLAKVPQPYTEVDALQFIASNTNKVIPNYHIFHNDTLIGGIGLGGLVGLGYWLIPDAWGQGIATEASAALLSKHFENEGATPILSGYLKDNFGSANVQAKLGFVITGESIVETVLLGKVDHEDTRITRADWVRNLPKLKELGVL
jgi:RimJ/RimL family protein N-acetyltransferase